MKLAPRMVVWTAVVALPLGVVLASYAMASESRPVVPVDVRIGGAEHAGPGNRVDDTAGPPALEAPAAPTTTEEPAPAPPPAPAPKPQVVPPAPPVDDDGPGGSDDESDSDDDGPDGSDDDGPDDD